MLDVMFYEVFQEEKRALQKYLPKALRVAFSAQTIQQTKAPIPPAAIISIRTQSHIPRSWSKDLKGILTRSTGHDHLSVFLKDIHKKIPCGYLVDYCSSAVAEHAILVMLSLLRRLKQQIRQFHVFRRDDITGQECAGKKMLIIGVGNIGAKITVLAKALGVQVRGVDLIKRRKDITYVSLEKGIRWADIVVCAAALTDKSEGLLNYKLFKKAKLGLIFINVSRGEISPLKDLRRLLDEGILGGLSLDVYPDEPRVAEILRGEKKQLARLLKQIHALKDRDNVIFTPHNAFNSREALEQKAKQTADTLRMFIKKGRFFNQIVH
ncbi:MAG: hypothetical protein A2Z88_07300 [Omnitrophica WOR_2 bacterium GWA2_47_8]|nr:MAG: hypothetical protein A2Z88_07300 [Omnitrophica WOR_2 bacterium GWA2_47_8]